MANFVETVSLLKISEPLARDPLKELVASVLGLAPVLDTAWDIIDTYPSDENPELVLAHYNQDYSPYNRLHEPLRRVRGIVIDVNAKKVVADSYGHTQALPCYQTLIEDDEAVHVPTEVPMYINTVETAPEEMAKLKVGTREFDKNSTKLFLGYEGAMVRIFKWNNKVFFSTHRRIDAIRSNWGGRRPFYELYKELNGPDLESFFGSEPSSPYCYMLLIAHNEIRLASSTRDNRIIFIGAKKLWDGEGSIWTPVTSLPEDVFSPEINRPLIVQPSIDVDTANKFLFPTQHATRIPDTNEAREYNAKEQELIVEYATPPPEGGVAGVKNIYVKPLPQKPLDDRLEGGDFLILYTQADNGDTIVYRLESPAYEYRVGITANDPNMYHRFAVAMVDFTKGDPADLLSTYPRYDQADLSEPQDRQKYWWSLFYNAVAPAYKDKVSGFYRQYLNDIDRVANFILVEFPKLITRADPEEMKRLNINTQKRMGDLRRIATGQKISGQSPYNIIRNLLFKETGPSLYKMIVTVQNINKLKNQPKVTA